VHHLRRWGGVTRHAVGTLRGCATSVRMLLRPGGHDVLAPRRGVWVPHGDSVDGDDLRRDPLAVRKATLASVLARAAPGLQFNEHPDEEDGPTVFAHACKLGLEGIVSKRKDSSYRSGRSPDWIK
jgi:ATP dependent DNA ligase domain